MSDDGKTTLRQYLSFFVGHGEYAVEIESLREIIPYGEITRLPRVPAFVRGLINLRGSVVPVVDLALRLGLSETLPTARSSIVIAELDLDGERTRIGLITDNVHQVIELGDDDIEPAPSMGAPVGARFLRGIGKLADRFVLILDTETVIGGDAMRMAWHELAAPALQADDG
jgi:purine-binding chemotaxis protein CheW